jgi:hypothetical protein
VPVSSGSNIAEVSLKPIDVAVLFLRLIVVDAVVVVVSVSVSVSVCVVVFVNQAKVVPSSGPGRVDHPTRGFVCVILIFVMLGVSLGSLSTMIELVMTFSGCLGP